LNSKDTIIKYGLYYIGLTDKAFYWEIAVINARKVLFIAIAVSLSMQSKMIQALICFVVLYINIQLLKSIQPYTKAYLNDTDILSTNAAIGTMLMGIMFLEEDTTNDEVQRITFFFILMTFNIVFLVWWFWAIGKVAYHKLKGLVRRYEESKRVPEKTNEDGILQGRRQKQLKVDLNDFEIRGSQ